VDTFITNNERISTNNEPLLYVCVYAYCLASIQMSAITVPTHTCNQ